MKSFNFFITLLLLFSIVFAEETKKSDGESAVYKMTGKNYKQLLNQGGDWYLKLYK